MQTAGTGFGIIYTIVVVYQAGEKWEGGLLPYAEHSLRSSPIGPARLFPSMNSGTIPVL
jgi:hypothetical protein